ncbi:CAMK family protein kinase [Histomonas meleagridis]|uniref:CAMK family protein kinase n=1 Tax=Histomonas meleagridis TaxID=135588 RepID=UPI00355A45B7|nr:CAMK family protein kinase [Histomonas meleagridis]KAH0798614.1 CAMK family protein kinase [Histomonas meleagridis]
MEIQHLLPKHHYHYNKFVGAGGCGSVFLVRSDRYNQDFCIKRISHPDANYGDHTVNEVTTLIRLCHPNIISMYEFFFDEPHANLYIVLEYCSGGSLKELVEKEGPIRPPKLYSYCYQILKALLHCHEQNVAHRDIKPANILLDNYGRPKLADFGLSRQLEKGEIINSYAGSRPFMAPEIVSHQNTDPFMADIWSLGITFYSIAFGRLPWGSCNDGELEMAIKIGFLEFPPYADPEFCKLIRSMTAVNPLKREPLSKLLKSPIFNNIQKHSFSSLCTQHKAESLLQTGAHRRSKSTVPASSSDSQIVEKRRSLKSYMTLGREMRSNSRLHMTFI